MYVILHHFYIQLLCTFVIFSVKIIQVSKSRRFLEINIIYVWPNLTKKWNNLLIHLLINIKEINQPPINDTVESLLSTRTATFCTNSWTNNPSFEEIPVSSASLPKILLTPNCKKLIKSITFTYSALKILVYTSPV